MIDYIIQQNIADLPLYYKNMEKNTRDLRHQYYAEKFNMVPEVALALRVVV